MWLKIEKEKEGQMNNDLPVRSPSYPEIKTSVTNVQREMQLAKGAATHPARFDRQGENKARDQFAS